MLRRRGDNLCAFFMHSSPPFHSAPLHHLTKHRINKMQNSKCTQSPHWISERRKELFVVETWVHEKKAFLSSFLAALHKIIFHKQQTDNINREQFFSYKISSSTFSYSVCLLFVLDICSLWVPTGVGRVWRAMQQQPESKRHSKFDEDDFISSIVSAECVSNGR